jgi:hypothetical protein
MPLIQGKYSTPFQVATTFLTISIGVYLLLSADFGEEEHVFTPVCRSDSCHYTLWQFCCIS